MRLKATFYYTGSNDGPTFREVEVVGIHRPRLNRGGRMTIYGYEETAGQLPTFKTYHVDKCSGLVVKLVGIGQVAGDTFNPARVTSTTKVIDDLRAIANRLAEGI